MTFPIYYYVETKDFGYYYKYVAQTEKCYHYDSIIIAKDTQKISFKVNCITTWAPVDGNGDPIGQHFISKKLWDYQLLLAFNVV